MSTRVGSKTRLKGKAARDSPVAEPEVRAMQLLYRQTIGFLRPAIYFIRCHRNRIKSNSRQLIFVSFHAQTEPEEEVVPQLAWRVIDEPTAKQLRKMTVDDVAK